MSTKIYDAYRHSGRKAVSLAGLFSLSGRIRKVLAAAAERGLVAKAAQELAALVDRACAGTQAAAENDLDKLAISYVRDASEEARGKVESGLRSPSWDFTAEWTFHFVNGRLLIQLFAERYMVDEFEKAFPEFVDYHYQTSTDRPANIPENEWRRRRLDWAKALGSKSAAESGLSMSLWGASGGPRIGQDLTPIIKAQPPLAARLNLLAKEIVSNQWIARRLANKGNVPSHVAMGVVMDFRGVSVTPSIQARIARKAQALRPLLYQTIGGAEALSSLAELRRTALRKRKAALL